MKIVDQSNNNYLIFTQFERLVRYKYKKKICIEYNYRSVYMYLILIFIKLFLLIYLNKRRNN